VTRVTMAADREHPGTCAACGHEQSPFDPLIHAADGAWIHRSHALDPGSGYYGTRLAEGS
jgi:hypothetical protein